MVAKKANEGQETFGELITSRLLELGWSNAELARRTGFSATYIGNLARDIAPGTKTGKPKRIPDETVERIARELNIPINRARTAAGLSKKEPIANTIDEAVDNALGFHAPGGRISEADKKALRAAIERSRSERAANGSADLDRFINIFINQLIDIRAELTEMRRQLEEVKKDKGE